MLLPLVTITTFDVILMLSESSHGLVGTCVYKPHLFGARTIDRLLRDFQEGARTYGNAAGAADLGNPSFAEAIEISPRRERFLRIRNHRTP